jgi:hypothetical protein
MMLFFIFRYSFAAPIDSADFTATIREYLINSVRDGHGSERKIALAKLFAECATFYLDKGVLGLRLATEDKYDVFNG